MESEDTALKSEIDAITHQIDHILAKIESVVPFNEADKDSDDPAPQTDKGIQDS